MIHASEQDEEGRNEVEQRDEVRSGEQYLEYCRLDNRPAPAILIISSERTHQTYYKISAYILQVEQRDRGSQCSVRFLLRQQTCHGCDDTPIHLTTDSPVGSFVKYEAAVELVLSLAYAVTFHMMITLQIMI